MSVYIRTEGIECLVSRGNFGCELPSLLESDDESIRTFRLDPTIRNAPESFHPLERVFLVPARIYDEIWLKKYDLSYLAGIHHKIVTYRHSSPTGIEKLKERKNDEPSIIAKTLCFSGFSEEENATMIYFLIVPTGSKQLDMQRLRESLDIGTKQLEISKTLPPAQQYGNTNPFIPKFMTERTKIGDKLVKVGGIYFEKKYFKDYFSQEVDFGIGSIAVPKSCREKISLVTSLENAYNILSNILPERVHIRDLL